MNKSFNTDYISKLVDTYIFEKQNAYYNYEIFASLTDEKRISFLLSINEKDYGSKLINTAIIILINTTKIGANILTKLSSF